MKVVKFKEFMRLAGNQFIENLSEEMKDYISNVVMVSLEESNVSLLGKINLREIFKSVLKSIEDSKRIMQEEKKGVNPDEN